ncbi:MAG: enoyl-CoA hydratase/isomerase family protein [Deltaproteobacteria bacterium]|nr:enoyl-CoA hydratase/isomerase family protein [Deltaproteobacteria bacterium]
MGYKNLLIVVDREGIAVITLNRPESLNALNMETMDELDKALTECEKNVTVKALILTGSGKAFVAGADITQFNALSPEQAKEFARRGQEIFNKVENFPHPVVGAINGFALGGGCELALSCDFLYASTYAKLGQPEVNLGIICGWGGTQRLVRHVGLPKARELLYSGEMIDAHEAYRIGLVNKVCDPQKLLDEVKAKLKLILSRGPLAVSRTKKIVNDTFKESLEKGLHNEQEGFSSLFGTEDKKEGVNAFLEKRPANFQGK